MIHGQHYQHGGAFQIQKFQDFLFVERFRNSAPYLDSWQKDWKLLWMQQINKSCLNLVKLSEQKLSDTVNFSEVYHYQRLYDGTHENSILAVQSDDRLFEPINSIQDVGEFMHYAIQQEMGCQYGRDLDGVKYLMNTADSNIRPLHLSLPSEPNGDDPLLTFDNPLWRLDQVELYNKLPITHTGPVGLVTPYRSSGPEISMINICHVGCTAWIIIHPSCSERLLQKVSECIYLKQDSSRNTFNCFVANKKYSVTLEQLEQWEIQYTVIFQEEGHILILFPGVLYGTCNLCFCINSSMKFLTLFNEEAKGEPKSSWPFEDSNYSSKTSLATINKAIWDWMYIQLLLKVDNSPQTDTRIRLPVLPPASTIPDESHVPQLQESSNTFTSMPSGEDAFTSEPILSGVLTSITFSLEDTSGTTFNPPSTNLIDDYNCLSPTSLFENLFDNDETGADSVLCENTSITWDDAATNSQLPSASLNFECSPNNDGHEFVTKYREICTEMGGLSVERFPEQGSCSESLQFPMEPGLELLASNKEENSDNGCGFSTSLELAPTFPTDDIAYTIASSVMCSSNQFEFSTIETGALNTLVSNNYPDSTKACENTNTTIFPKSGEEDQVKNGVECPQCYRQLSNKSHLKRHMYLKHSASNISVQCPICMKMFANEISLQRHRGSVSRNPTRKRNLCRGLTERITNDNRLRCPTCGQLFVLKSGLNRHLKNIHNQAPQKNGHSL